MCNFFARYQKPFSLSRCLIVVFFGKWDYGTVGLCDVAADGKKNFSHCLIVSFSHCRLFWTMGLWDYGTMGRRGRQKEKLFSLSHFPIFSLSSFLDNGTLRRWDYGTSRPPIKLCAKRTLPFTFQFVVVPERTVREGEPLRTFVRSFANTHSKFNNLLCRIESQYVAVGYDATIAYRTTYTHARSIQRYRHVVHHALHEHLTLHSTAIHIV